MKTISLSNEEINILEQLLEAAAAELSMEIADTDRQEFREKLKHRRRVYIRTLHKLREPETAAV